MKKIYTCILLSAASLLFTINSSGTVWTVTVNASSFSPNTLPNVVCGDTILWVLSSGTHTTTSTNIPAGATPWNSIISAAIPAFGYRVPNFAGVYNYICTPHGFTGSFTVSCSVGMNEAEANISSAVYPNPFNSQLTLENHNADAVKIMDLTGQVVFAMPLNTSGSKSEISLSMLAPGIYFLATSKEGVVRDTKRVVKINR